MRKAPVRVCVLVSYCLVPPRRYSSQKNLTASKPEYFIGISGSGIGEILGLRATSLADMAIRVRTPAGGRLWVGQVANYISDPVARLRFLKAVAPTLSEGEPSRSLHSKRLLLFALVAVAALLSFSLWRVSARAGPRPAPHLPTEPVVVAMVERPRGGPDVWPVERSAGSETYSNGLRLDTRFAIATHSRSYLAFPVDRSQPAER